MNHFKNGVTSESIKKAVDYLRETLHRNIDFRYNTYLFSEYYDSSFLIKETEEGKRRMERMREMPYTIYNSFPQKANQ